MKICRRQNLAVSFQALGRVRPVLPSRIGNGDLSFGTGGAYKINCPLFVRAYMYKVNDG
jgi:hypothetical protein